MGIEFEVWKGKDLSGLFKDIYNNQKETQAKITLLIDMLRPLVNNAGDAAVIVPLIAEYLDISVKNDSHLVRLSAVVQKLYATERIGGDGSAGGLLSDEEKRKLLEDVAIEVRELKQGEQDTQKQLDTTQKEMKQLLESEESEDEDGV